MVILLCLGYVLFELPPEPLIIASAIVAGLIAIKLGYSYNDILESISQKLRKPAGDLNPDCGRIYDRCMDGRRNHPHDDLLRPENHRPAIFVDHRFSRYGRGLRMHGHFLGFRRDDRSCLHGGWCRNGRQSYGCGRRGCSGAYFGDKLSPLSDTTNIAALSTGVNLYEHIGHLLYTTRRPSSWRGSST